MKKKFLSGLVGLLALATMASCGETTSSSVPASSVSTSSVAASSSVADTSSVDNSSTEANPITALSITNKDALKAEWHAGDATRKIELSVTPTSNITALINQGKLTVTSSAETVVSASGLTLSAVGAGTATITVAAGSITDTVEITVAATLTAKEKYQTVHAGTEDDPLDNEDAVKIAKAVGEDSANATDKYFVQGVVKSFREAPSSHGNVSFYFTAAEGKTEQFLAYRVKKGEAGADVTADDIWVGGTATIYCNFYAYKGNTYENSTGYLVSCTGDKPTIETHEVTASGAVAACKALDENSSSTDIYVVTGYVANNDGSSLYLVDNDLTEAQTIDSATMFQVYNFKTVLTDAAEQAKCTVGAKVKVTCTIKYYKSTSSTSFAYETSTISEIVVLEAGETEKAPTEATVAEALTVCNALADSGKTTDKYAVTGYITEVTYAYSTQSKSISLNIADSVTETDATKMLSIYKGVLADGVDADKLVAGAQIKVTGILNKYVNNGKTSLQMAAGGEIALLKEKEVVAPTAIALPETATVNMGETLTLDLTLTPVNATLTGDVTWTSSVEGVATVAKGVVTPVSAGTTVITATYGDLTATCTVTVAAALNYGTEAAPLTVTELNTLGATIVPNNEDWSTKVVYVSAKITSVPSYNEKHKSYTFNFADPVDATKKGIFYSGALDTDVTKIAQNDTVVLAGYLENYNGDMEIAYYGSATGDFKTPKVLSRTAGTSAITVGDHENVTISDVTVGGTAAETLPATATNDTVITFKATAAEGYQVSEVKAYGQVITAAEGVYTVTVAGDVELTISAISSSEVLPTTVSKALTEIATENNWTTSAGSDVVNYTSFELDSVVTISTTGNPNCGSFWNDGWRLYQSQNGNLIISVKEGSELQKATIKYTTSKNGTLMFGDDKVESESEVAISGSSVTFTVGNTGTATNGQVRVSEISVTYVSVSEGTPTAVENWITIINA